MNRVSYILCFKRVFRLYIYSYQLLHSLRPYDAYALINRPSCCTATCLCGILFRACNCLLVASGDSHLVFTYYLAAKPWLPNLMHARCYFLTHCTCSPYCRFFFTANSKSYSVSMFYTVRCRLLRVIYLNAPALNRLLRANVVNAASLLPCPVSPREVITIFRACLAP